MGQRLAVVVGVALALVAAACRDGSSDKRPVAKPGRIVTITDQNDLEGSELHVVFDLAVAPDGSLYVIEDRSADIGKEPGFVNNLWVIPPRGPARVVAGIPRSRDKIHGLGPADVVDPSPRLGKRSLAMQSVAVGPDGTVFVGDLNNMIVWALAPDGRGRAVAGTGQQGFSGDGGPATAAMIGVPDSLAVNPATGDLYIGTSDNRIRKIDSAGLITTVAGDGTAASEGDGVPAVNARLRKADSMAVDPRTGTLYFCDVFLIRKIDSAGKIVSVAGDGTEPTVTVPPGRPATEAPADCDSVAVDPRDGIVYFAGDKTNQIRRITRSGLIEVVGGTGETGRAADGKRAASTPISPTDLAIDREGNIFFVGQTSVAYIHMVGAQPPVP